MSVFKISHLGGHNRSQTSKQKISEQIFICRLTSLFQEVEFGKYVLFAYDYEAEKKAYFDADVQKSL